MGTVHSHATTMKFLVVLFLAVAAAHAGVVLPYASLGYGYAGVHAVPAVAKSTIKYKTAAFEPVDVLTHADAVKIELKETEHEQEILTPTIKYVANPLPAVVGAVGYHGLGLGYHGLGLGYGYGLPLVHAAAPAAEE